MTREHIQPLALVATAVTTAVVSAAWALHANLGARFGPIDDHEPLRWLGSDGSLSLLETIEVLLHDTEIANFGAAMRFRPAYYAFRVGQTVLFGDNPSAWYSSVFVLFVTACAVIGLTLGWWLRLGLRRAGVPTRPEFAISLAATALYTLSVASISAWSGIVTRLGPSELLGATMVGASLFAATAIIAGRSKGWWAVLLVSVWGAVFAKEVLAPLALLPAVAAFGVAKEGLRTASRWVLALAGFVPAGLLAVAVVPPLIAGTGSAYGSRSDASRVSATLENLFQVLLTYWAPAAVVACGAVVTFVISQWNRQRRVAIVVAAAYLLSLAWFAFDALIYYGAYELPRYGMNWQLVKVMWIAGAVSLAVSILNDRGKWWPTLPAVALLFSSVFLFVLGVVGAPQRLESTQLASETNALQTRQYQEQMDVVRKELASEPNASVAIIVEQPTDYEPVRAVSQSLENYTLKNVVAVLNPASPSLAVLSELKLPVSAVVSTDELADGEWICVYLRSDPSVVDLCPVDLSFNVETWAM